MAIVSVSAPTSLPPSGAATGDLTGTFPAPTIAASAVTSAKIADGTIVNADVSATAGIVASKLSGVVLAGQAAIADVNVGVLNPLDPAGIITAVGTIQTALNTLLAESRTAGLLLP